MTRIPDTLHICPGCAKALVSGVNRAGVPELCGPCEVQRRSIRITIDQEATAADQACEIARAMQVVAEQTAQAVKERMRKEARRRLRNVTIAIAAVELLMGLVAWLVIR